MKVAPLLVPCVHFILIVDPPPLQVPLSPPTSVQKWWVLVLMRRAGHASPAAALRYQHATEDRDKGIANAFDQTLRGDVAPILKSDRSRRVM